MTLPRSWSEIGFEVEFTGDQSPSLRSLKPNYPDAEKGESMHHSGGAAAETELIYGSVIAESFRALANPQFVSVGLGLGYVELTVAREALIYGKNFRLQSFESVTELGDLFCAWLRDEPGPSFARFVYDQVAEHVLKVSNFSPADLKRCLQRQLAHADWTLSGALEMPSQAQESSHCLLFDAFSAKTTPELWDEEFLGQLFGRLSADALVSTYACRAGLKRALARNHFEVEIRPGFHGKRNSTLGRRGIFFRDGLTSAPAETF